MLTFILELQKWLGDNEFLWSISLNLLQKRRLLWVKKEKVYELCGIRIGLHST